MKTPMAETSVVPTKTSVGVREYNGRGIAVKVLTIVVLADVSKGLETKTGGVSLCCDTQRLGTHTWACLRDGDVEDEVRGGRDAGSAQDVSKKAIERKKA